MSVHIGAVFIFLKHLAGDKAGIRTVQKHSEGRVHGQDHNGKLSNQIGQRVYHHKEIPRMVIFTQLLERVVGSVGHQVLGNMIGVKHHAQGNGTFAKSPDGSFILFT